MKKSCVVFLGIMFCVCITSLPVFSESNEWLLSRTQTDLDNDGEYEEIHEYTYDYNADDRLETETKRSVYGSSILITVTTRTYNTQGDVITEQVTADSETTLPDWSIVRTRVSSNLNTYTYDSSRKLLSLTSKNDTNGDGTADEVYAHHYDHDTNGRVKTDREDIDYDNDSARDAVKLTTYTYNADGIASEQRKSDNDMDGSFEYIYWYGYTYDDSGNLIRIDIAYDDDNDGMTDRKKITTISYMIDASGESILTKTESFDSNGVLSAVKLKTETYDIEDNLTNAKRETDNNNDGIFIVDTLTYRYTGGQRTYLGYDQGDDGSIESYTYYSWSQANAYDVDNDGDTYKENQGDCDDTDPAINPGATEICGDGIDQDCDGEDKQCIVSEIKANGSDGPIDLTSIDNLSITIELSPGGFAGDNADWWLVAATPFGWFHYQPDVGSWVPDLTYSHQGPLFNLGEFGVLNISGLPAGSYTLYFGVDMNMNGSLDMDQIYYDSVTINI